jgi:hypothetical protein
MNFRFSTLTLLPTDPFTREEIVAPIDLSAGPRPAPWPKHLSVMLSIRY